MINNINTISSNNITGIIVSLCVSVIILNYVMIRYDDTNKYAFVAEYSGIISVIKLDESNFHRVTKLEGHTSKWVWYYCIHGYNCVLSLYVSIIIIMCLYR